jgi:hypothetical protein
MGAEQIDRDKLRAAIRRLGDLYAFYILDEAIDLLPQTKLKKLAKRYFDPSTLRPDNQAKKSLLDEVKAFQKASLASEYYQDFDVNSKNCMDMSTGTRAWIADCNRLLDRSVREAKTGEPATICEAFGIIFGLLDHIDECLDDVIFFADEAGSWQVSVDWEKVLPPWFKVLSATVDPVTYAQRVTTILTNHYNYGSEKMLALAHKLATEDQRRALADQ